LSAAEGAGPRVYEGTIVLFDIDGTLIRTDRAGSRAMNRAFDDLFGIAGAFDGIEMAGRTDKWILEDAAARAGVHLSGGNFERFRDRYFERLFEALAEHGPHSSATRQRAHDSAASGRGETDSRRGVLPGVQSLLETIGERTDIFPALLTGNCEQGARIKLEHFDLWKFFRCGAYGDEAIDRRHLFDVALQRAEECGAPRVRREDVIVVGDTVLDVACGSGEHARLLAGHGFVVDGLDLDPAFVRIARHKHPSGRFFEADMAGFDLPDRYDAILCSSVRSVT